MLGQQAEEEEGEGEGEGVGWDGQDGRMRLRMEGQVMESSQADPDRIVQTLRSKVREMEAQARELEMEPSSSSSSSSVSPEPGGRIEMMMKKKKVYEFEEVERIRSYYQRKLEEVARKGEARLRAEKRRPLTATSLDGRITGVSLGELGNLKAENIALRARVEEMQQTESAYALNLLNENQVIAQLRKQVEEIPHWQSAFERQELEVEQNNIIIAGLREENNRLKRALDNNSKTPRHLELEKRIADLEKKHAERERSLNSAISDMRYRHHAELQLQHEKFKAILMKKDEELTNFRHELNKIKTKFGL